MGTQLQHLDLSRFEPDQYQNSSPLVLSQLCKRFGRSTDLQDCRELLLLTDEQDSHRITAGMVLPDKEALFALTDWPVAESWNSAATILTAYAELASSRNSGRPILILKQVDVDCETTPQCGPFRLLTTILTYRYSFRDRRSAIQYDRQAGESLRVVTVSLDDTDTLELLEVIGSDSQDCPELQSIMDWKTRLADYRDAEDIESIHVRQLRLNERPIGVAVWTEPRQSHEAEPKEAALKYAGIRPDHRNRGWGTRFLNLILSEWQQRDRDAACLHVDSRNDFAMMLYEKCGFQNSAQQELWIAHE